MHGDLDKELYLKVPQGIEGFDNKFLKIKRSLYGLKQAGHEWNGKIDDSLRRLGFLPLVTNHCVYVQQQGNDWYYIALYVDDLLFIGPDKQFINRILDGLESEYGVKRLGDAEYVLGIQIHRRQNGLIVLSQEAYIDSMLERFGMNEAKPASTPLPAGLKLERSKSPQSPDNRKLYQSIVGSLTYAATGTRPDISHAVGFLGQFNAYSDRRHLKAALHVLRYLKGTRTFGMAYGGPGTPLKLKGYTDTAYADQAQTSHSSIGNHVKLGSGSVTWSSSSTGTVSYSTTESEYLGMNEVARTILGLRETLGELGLPQTGPTDIFNDNQGAISRTKNPVGHHALRHLRVQDHAICQHVRRKLVTLNYVPTADLSADVLTKNLGPKPFIKHQAALGMIQPDA